MIGERKRGHDQCGWLAERYYWICGKTTDAENPFENVAPENI